MDVLENLILEYEAAGRDDAVQALHGLRGSELRKIVKHVPALEREHMKLKAEVARVERAPKVKQAFIDAGVDFGALHPLERQLLESFDGELDARSVTAFLSESEIQTPER